MSNYTGGEWMAFCLGSEGYQVKQNNEGIPTAKVKEERRYMPICPIVFGKTWEEQKNNANLIATAPDMYEALKHTQIVLDNLKAVYGSLTQQQNLLDIEISKALDKVDGK